MLTNPQTGSLAPLPPLAHSPMGETAAMPALVSDKMSSHGAFNVNMGVRHLIKFPGDFLYGVSKFYNGLASERFRNSPYFSEQDWRGNLLIDTIVPPALRPPEHSPEVSHQLQELGSGANFINSLIKISTYFISSRGDLLSEKINQSDGVDAIHQRLMTIKNMSNYKENFGMTVDKAMYLGIFALVMGEMYEAAALARCVGLVASGIAWGYAVRSGIAIIKDEFHMRNKSRERIAGGSDEKPYLIHTGNMQRAITGITGAMSRIPSQAIALGGAGLILARQNTPDLFQKVASPIDQAFAGSAHFIGNNALVTAIENILPGSAEKLNHALTYITPNFTSYVNDAISHVQHIDPNFYYAWVNGSYEVPALLITAFMGLGVIGPGLSLLPNVSGLYKSSLAYLSLQTKQTLHPSLISNSLEHQQLKIALRDSIISCMLGSASSTLLMGGWALMANPESEAHGIFLHMMAGGLTATQYFYGERKAVKEFIRNLPQYSKQKWAELKESIRNLPQTIRQKVMEWLEWFASLPAKIQRQIIVTLAALALNYKVNSTNLPETSEKDSTRDNQ